jgi:hypothetical protein
MGDRGTVSALYPIFFLLSPPAKAVGITDNSVSHESAMKNVQKHEMKQES